MAGKKKISKNEIRNRCALENNITVNCPGAVAFFEYLNLIDTSSSIILPSPELNSIAKQSEGEIIKQLATRCINRLIEEGIFDKDVTGFNVEKGHLTIKRSAFPLAYAAIRNFLTTVGALGKEENGEIYVAGSYETSWAEQLKSRRKKTTIEQLIKQQKDQQQRGLEAEEFVLRLERKRLPELASNIKRISDLDVAAGYDIVSYENSEAKQYNRFIEVKCYIGIPHFYWSENESDVARAKSEEYILCLVNYERINEAEYEPEYIANCAFGRTAVRNKADRRAARDGQGCVARTAVSPSGQEESAPLYLHDEGIVHQPAAY